MDGNLTRFSSIPSVIMVNTDLIGNVKVNGYADLLNPALKGKIAFADGEYTVGPTFEQGAVQYAVAGSPVEIKYMEEGVIFRCDGIYIVKNCRHLESAKAFVDWATSKQAQTILSESQNRRSIRKDVPSPSNMESMYTINVITDDEDYSSAHKTEWIAKFKDIYTE